MGLAEKIRLSITSSNQSEDEDKVALDESCGFEVGCGSCRGQRCRAYFCQCFATTRWALVVLSFGAIVQGFFINGHTPAVISTLEKRFELTSTESGLIASFYDIAGSLAILFVTYFGGNGHKPLWIGWGIFFIGLSGILFSMPHFMAPHYDVVDSFNLCGNATSESCVISTLKNFRFWFYGAFVIAGVGSAPLYSLSITYLDENVKQRYSSMYNAIFLAMSVVGPGGGFLIGSAFLQEYTYPEERTSLDESSELWVGAWWIGYLIFGVIGILISIPVLMLPRVIPGTEEHRMNRETETHQSSLESPEEKDFGKTIRDFPRCVLLLFRNPTFIFLSLSVAIDSLLIGGIAVFGAKYLETQFGIDPSDAGTYFGLLAILGGAGGLIAGGAVIAKFNFSVTKMLHMSYIAPALAALCSFSFLITCSNPQFAGVTTAYHDSSLSNPAIFDQCNDQCNCNRHIYNPVCGSDGFTYFSSCFAGCSNKTGEKYFNCSCVTTTNSNQSLNHSGTASIGACLDDHCGTGWEIITLCIFTFLIMFFTFFNELSALQASIRCVPFSRRSFGIGIQTLFTRVLGTVPGPLVMGAIFDGNCIKWTEECDVRGSCLAYNNKDLSLHVTLFLVIGKIVGVLLFLAALITYKPISNESPDDVSTNFDDSTKNSSSPGSLATISTLSNSLVLEQSNSEVTDYGTSRSNTIITPKSTNKGYDNPVFSPE